MSYVPVTHPEYHRAAATPEAVRGELGWPNRVQGP